MPKPRKSKANVAVEPVAEVQAVDNNLVSEPISGEIDSATSESIPTVENAPEVTPAAPDSPEAGFASIEAIHTDNRARMSVETENTLKRVYDLIEAGFTNERTFLRDAAKRDGLEFSEDAFWQSAKTCESIIRSFYMIPDPTGRTLKDGSAKMVVDRKLKSVTELVAELFRRGFRRFNQVELIIARRGYDSLTKIVRDADAYRESVVSLATQLGRSGLFNLRENRFAMLDMIAVEFSNEHNISNARHKVMEFAAGRTLSKDEFQTVKDAVEKYSKDAAIARKSDSTPPAKLTWDTVLPAKSNAAAA